MNMTVQRTKKNNLYDSCSGSTMLQRYLQNIYNSRMLICFFLCGACRISNKHRCLRANMKNGQTNQPTNQLTNAQQPHSSYSKLKMNKLKKERRKKTSSKENCNDTIQIVVVVVAILRITYAQLTFDLIRIYFHFVFVFLFSSS